MSIRLGPPAAKMLVYALTCFLITPVATAQTASPVGPIAHINITGNARVPTQEVLAHVAEKLGDEYDPAVTAKDQEALKATGQFSDVQVRATSDLEIGVDLTISVTEITTVKAITFTADTPDGRLPVPAEDLRARMETKVGQPFNANTLAKDLSDLFGSDTGYLSSQGFQVTVPADINIDPNTDVLTVPLSVARVARIDVVGGRRAAAEVRDGLTTKVDDVFNLNTLQKDLIRMQGHGSVAQDKINIAEATAGPGQIVLTIRVIEKSGSGRNTSAAADWLPLPNQWDGPIIPVQINGTETASFLVNTTALVSGVSPELAARMHLTPHPWVIGGKPVLVDGHPGQTVTLARMRLGSAPGVVAKDETMPIYDTKAMSANLGRRIDGVLGMNDIGAQAVSLDWDRRQVRFWERGNLSADERKAAGFANALALPLKATGTMLAVDVSLTGSVRERPETMGLATANPDNQLSATEAKTVGLTSFDDTSKPPSQYTRPSRLSAGGLSVNDLLFQLSSDDAPALLGQNFLSRYRVLLDYAAQKVYLQPVVRVTGAHKSCTIPFTYDPITTPVPVIEASLDGGPPMRFVFDTGFNNVLTLDRHFAVRLGLSLDNTRHLVLNQTVPLALTSVRRMVLRGRTRSEDLDINLARAGVTDLELMKDTTAGSPVAGIIGAGILRDTAVRFDFHARTLTFFPKPLPDSTPDGAVALPLTESSEDDAYFVTLTPEPGREMRLLVDSGSTGTNIPFGAMSSLHPDSFMVNGSWMLSSFTLGEDIHLPHFNLGQLAVPDTTVEANPTESSGAAWAPGTLGENILSRYRVTLDPPHQRLLVEPPAGPQFRGGWPGMFLHRIGGGIKIRRVQPGSPAAQAGLCAGDQVLRIDGHSLQGVGPMLAQSLADGANETVGVFQVQRGTNTPHNVSISRSSLTQVEPPALDGLIGRRDLAHPLVVSAVLRGSAAEDAGIRVGDMITTINRMVTATMTDSQWEDVLFEPRLTLTVRPATSLDTRTLVLLGRVPPSSLLTTEQKGDAAIHSAGSTH